MSFELAAVVIFVLKQGGCSILSNFHLRQLAVIDDVSLCATLLRKVKVKIDARNETGLRNQAVFMLTELTSGYNSGFSVLLGWITSYRAISPQ